MSRRLKPYKIEELIVENTSYRVPILFDRHSQKFYVEFADEVIVSGPLLDTVRREAKAKIQAMSAFEWKKSIFAEFHSNKTPERNYSYGGDDMKKEQQRIRIDCEFSRHEYAKRPGDPHGNTVERPFGEEDTPVTDYRYFNPRGFAIEIPYSDEAWAGLLALEEKFDELCGKLFAMFHSQNFENALKQISVDSPFLLDMGKDDSK